MTQHVSASSTHYDQEAKTYDAFNEAKSVVVNQTIEAILSKQNVSTVLDLACGTGAQVFWLAESGFEVCGIDINERMLSLAEEKAKAREIKVKLAQGDMRTSQLGQFDAVVTIFNAIGHLTQSDFSLALKNIHKNLQPGGLYIFDIFNLDYLLHEDNITKLTIDWQKKSGDIVNREIQYSTISTEGILASYDIYHEQCGSSEPQISTAFQTLQVYSVSQLKFLLADCGFEMIMQCNLDGTRFDALASESVLIVARAL